MKLEQLKRLVNEEVSLEKVLNKIPHKGDYRHGKPCFCPFHDNTNTEAAVFYDDPDGQKIWCFVEQRQYRASDALEILSGMNVYEVGSEIWESMSEIEQEHWLQSHNDDDALARAFSGKTIEVDDNLLQLVGSFKNGEITITDLLMKYADLYKETHK